MFIVCNTYVGIFIGHLVKQQQVRYRASTTNKLKKKTYRHRRHRIMDHREDNGNDNSRGSRNAMSSAVGTKTITGNRGSRRKQKLVPKGDIGEENVDCQPEELQNVQLMRAHLLTDPVEIVDYAACYISHSSNVALVEWCEAILLQMCNLHEILVFENMLWSDVKTFLTVFQFTKFSRLALTNHRYTNLTLLELFKLTRRRKKSLLDSFKVTPYMFSKTPKIKAQLVCSHYKNNDNKTIPHNAPQLRFARYLFSKNVNK